MILWDCSWYLLTSRLTWLPGLGSFRDLRSYLHWAATSGADIDIHGISMILLLPEVQRLDPYNGQSACRSFM